MKCARTTIALTILLLLVGCSSSVVSGDPRTASGSVSRSGASSGGVSSGGASSGGASTGAASSGAANPSAAASRYPRTPVSTSIGDPATADLCAVTPLSKFEGLGYTPAYANGASPPGCSIEMRRAGQVALRINIFGVGSTGFSHVGPSSLDNSDPTGTRKVDGVTIAEYAYLPTDGGACPRDVLGRGITLSVYAITVTGPRDRKINCRAADIMASLMARVVAVGSAPRLQLATPSVTDLDFCSVLRATKLSDIDSFSNLTITPDGVGDNCKASGAQGVVLRVQFGVTSTQYPSGVVPAKLDGHTLYRTITGLGACGYASAQGRTSGGYERIATTLDDASGASTHEVCLRLRAATLRFLDTAGLT